jgi:glycosyltransferase involved in cell wall biosynthesis
MSAAIWYESDGYRPEGRPLMGRRVAGQGFLAAFARYARTERFTALVRTNRDSEEFLETVRALRPEVPATTLPLMQIGEVVDIGCLYYPGPVSPELAWVRRYFAPRSFSLCGVTHTISSLRAMKIIAEWPTTPFEPWDAIICTSQAVKAAVQRILEARVAQLRRDLGTTRFPPLRLPIIPLGVDCDRQAAIMGERDPARAALGIADDDFVVLFVGRITFNAKANPFPMYLALERIAAGRKVVLVECGWSDNEAIANAFAEARAAVCPSVRGIVLDGRDPQQLARAWACADCFCSLSDNIQETFGLTPIEAMASGLPCVVTDWNGYRDTVRDGVDGFAVPTLAPPRGFANDLVVSHALEVDHYGAYIGQAAAVTAVDCEATATAFERLAGDPELRRRLGANGRQRAREAFDWSVVVRAYEALWQELAEVRQAGLRKNPPRAGLVRWPSHLDPFDVFAGYATAVVNSRSVVRLLPAAETDAFEARLSLKIAGLSINRVPPLAALKQLRDKLRPGSQNLETFLGSYRNPDRVRALRGLMLMAKFGLVAIEQPPEPAPSAEDGASISGG